MNHSDHVGLLRDAVPAGAATWADLGSGTGAFTLALAEILGPGARIVSVDRDARALDEQERQLRARFPEVFLNAREADFTQDLVLPRLDGLLMANSLHFVADQVPVLTRLIGFVKPGGRFVLVEYDADQGNPWVPHPLSFRTWQRIAPVLGLSGTRLAGRVPSRFLNAIYSAVSDVAASPVAEPGERTGSR
jgi:ubiquinone/menaquinone biosynthesis C-methylase UbiE